jgi:FlaG/FlaF family flagellin (archaellin)
MTAGQNTAQLKGSGLTNGFVATVLVVAVVGLLLAAVGLAIRPGSVAAPASTTTIDAARIQFMADEHGLGVAVPKVHYRGHQAHIVPVPASIAALDAARIQFMADEHAASVPVATSDTTIDAARIQFLADEHAATP